MAIPKAKFKVGDILRDGSEKYGKDERCFVVTGAAYEEDFLEDTEGAWYYYDRTGADYPEGNCRLVCPKEERRDI